MAKCLSYSKVTPNKIDFKVGICFKYVAQQRQLNVKCIGMSINDIFDKIDKLIVIVQ